MQSFIPKFVEIKVVIYVWSLYFTPPPLKWPSLGEWVEERLWCHSLNNNNKRVVVVNKRVLLLLSLWRQCSPRLILLAHGHFNGSKIQTSHVKHNLSFNEFSKFNFARFLIRIISLRLCKRITRHFFIGEPLWKQ